MTSERGIGMSTMTYRASILQHGTQLWLQEQEQQILLDSIGNSPILKIMKNLYGSNR